ncbi:hypothetical protein NKDENANG_01853 [Candidatus Entotheonellaceae bacterium PAL068K]
MSLTLERGQSPLAPLGNVVETVMGWELRQQTKRKLFWDKAVTFYAR